MTFAECQVAGCEARVLCRGLCETHYRQWRRGSPINAPAKRLLDLTPEERFWLKVTKAAPNECWVWIGTITSEGYGVFQHERRGVGAHRFAYGLLVGPIPEDLQLDHLCRNRSCVNPAHLEPVTLKENVLRGFGPPAVNARKTHCKHGHALTPENTYTSRPGRDCRACAINRNRWTDELRLQQRARRAAKREARQP